MGRRGMHACYRSVCPIIIRRSWALSSCPTDLQWSGSISNTLHYNIFFRGLCQTLHQSRVYLQLTNPFFALFAHYLTIEFSWGIIFVSKQFVSCTIKLSKSSCFISLPLQMATIWISMQSSDQCKPFKTKENNQMSSSVVSCNLICYIVSQAVYSENK